MQNDTEGMWEKGPSFSDKVAFEVNLLLGDSDVFFKSKPRVNGKTKEFELSDKQNFVSLDRKRNICWLHCMAINNHSVGLLPVYN